MTNDSYVLQLRGVSKVYEQSAEVEPVEVLSDINLNVRYGTTLSIIGPSGSGKSTLLNIMGTLDRPSGGDVLLEGENLAQMNDRQLAQIRNRKIGFIFQAHHLLPQCTVLENVLVPTLVPGGVEDARERAHQLLERVGLAERLHHRPGQLSGGERQRVAFVRALINKPSLILADEPTGALDQVNAKRLMQLLIDLNREEGVTLIVVTHAPDLAQNLEHLMQLEKGQLVRVEKVHS
ncbi:MAG: ABC transporter ATP-binding protein [bacterium]|jgi:lipoprotein-releasing system ATP-binding protein